MTDFAALNPKQNFTKDHDDMVFESDEFEETEKFFGMNLPSEYKEYMATYGQFDFRFMMNWFPARFSSGWEACTVQHMGDVPFSFLNLYKGHTGTGGWKRPPEKRLLPLNFCPVADDINTHNLLLLNLNEDGYGTVHWWKNSDAPFGTEANPEVGFVAPDFPSFIALLDTEEAVLKKISGLD